MFDNPDGFKAKIEKAELDAVQAEKENKKTQAKQKKEAAKENEKKDAVGCAKEKCTF